MSTFDIWLWLKLDDIRDACSTLFFLFGILGGLLVAFATVARCIDDESRATLKPGLMVALWLFVALGWIGGAGNALLPSTKQAAAIYVVPQLVQSRVFTNDIPQLYDMAVQAMKEKLAAKVESK